MSKTFTELIGDPIIDAIDSRTGVSPFSAPTAFDIAGIVAMCLLEHAFDLSYAVEKRIFGWLW